eukprot:scpid37949/ scgid15720/ 
MRRAHRPPQNSKNNSRSRSYRRHNAAQAMMNFNHSSEYHNETIRTTSYLPSNSVRRSPKSKKKKNFQTKDEKEHKTHIYLETVDISAQEREGEKTNPLLVLEEYYHVKCG